MLPGAYRATIASHSPNGTTQPLTLVPLFLLVLLLSHPAYDHFLQPVFTDSGLFVVGDGLK